MKRAVEAVRGGKSPLSASKQFNVPRLQREQSNG